jgi:hypothetical protein
MWIDLGFTMPLKVFKYKIQYKREVAKGRVSTITIVARVNNPKPSLYRLASIISKFDH